MTFLNPAFLWASLAVLIPIIVHLFNFRRPKKVNFSNVAFVKEVRKSVVRRLRLKQWLLLAARILAILALVFMFAQPVKKAASGGEVAAGNTSVAIVLDNSYSMKSGNDKGSYWLQATKLAREIVRAYSRSDEFIVMPTSDLKIQYTFSDRETAEKELMKLKINQNSTDLGEMMALSDAIFEQANHPNRVLYFLSDFQESTILADTNLAKVKNPDIRMHMVPLATRPVPNVYLKEHGLTTGIIEAGKPANLSVTLKNESKDPSKNLSLRITIAGESQPVSTLDLAGGETRKQEFAFTPKQPGWQSGFLEIDDYPVEFDNKRFFSFYVPDKEKMLVVEGQPAPHLRLMFGGELLNTFDVTFKSFRDLAEVNFDDFKSILLVGLPEVSTGLQDKLLAHLREGRSIFFAPGEGTDLNSTNAFFNKLKIGSFQPVVANAKGEYADGVDLQHPMFDGVFVGNASNRKFDAPLVYKHFPFRTTNEIVQNVILRLGNGDPVLTESRPEGGLFYTMAFFPGNKWSDFTIKSSGLAVMVQLARLMNQSMRVQQNQDLGAYTTMRIKTREQDLIKLKGEGELELIPEQYAQSGYIVLKFDNLDLKEGNFDLVQNEKLLEKVSFNVPDEESELESLAEADLRKYLDNKGLQEVVVTPAAPSGFAQQLEIESKGIPLWKYFLALGAFFLLSELLITRMKDNA